MTPFGFGQEDGIIEKIQPFMKYCCWEDFQWVKCYTVIVLLGNAEWGESRTNHWAAACGPLWWGRPFISGDR